MCSRATTAVKITATIFIYLLRSEYSRGRRNVTQNVEGGKNLGSFLWASSVPSVVFLILVKDKTTETTELRQRNRPSKTQGSHRRSRNRRESSPMAFPLVKVEQQELRTVRVCLKLERRLFADGGAVAGLERFAVDREFAGNELHPCISALGKFVLYLVPGRE